MSGFWKQFAEDAEEVEDAAVRAVMLERLNEALHTLTGEEQQSSMTYSIRKSVRWNWRKD